MSAATDARRAIVRLIPKAKLSSLPRNHFARAVVTATIIDSAPRPKTVRSDGGYAIAGVEPAELGGRESEMVDENAF